MLLGEESAFARIFEAEHPPEEPLGDQLGALRKLPGKHAREDAHAPFPGTTSR
jgi:hypothetical protein